MQTTEKAFRTFEDLEAYQAARAFRKAMYAQEGWRGYQLLNGYIRYLRERKTGASVALRESAPAYGITDDELDAILDKPIQRFNDSTIQRFNER